jgi:hypothetical protein
MGKTLGRPGHKWKNNIKIILKGTEWGLWTG